MLVGVIEADTVRVGLALTVGVADGLAVGVPDAVTVRELLGVAEGV